MQKRSKIVTSSISERSTKAESLKAYKSLLIHLETEDEGNTPTAEEQKAVDSAAHETVEKIISDFSSKTFGKSNN